MTTAAPISAAQLDLAEPREVEMLILDTVANRDQSSELDAASPEAVDKVGLSLDRRVCCMRPFSPGAIRHPRWHIPLGGANLPALLSLALPQPQRLIAIELQAALQQGHRLIRQQLAAGDLQQLAPPVPTAGAEVQHPPPIAEPALPRRAGGAWFALARLHDASGAQPQRCC